MNKLHALVQMPGLTIKDFCIALNVTDVTVRNWLKEMQESFDGKEAKSERIKEQTLEALKNNKYNVTIKKETYTNKNSLAIFIDPAYGEFTATPNQIIRGQKVHPLRKGKAKTLSIDVVKQKLAQMHDINIVSIKESTYINGNVKCTFIDSEYGEWRAMPLKVLRGTGHPSRANKTISLKKSKSLQEIKESLPSHLSIDESTFIQSTKPARFVDAEYGEFWCEPNYVLRTNGHPERTTAAKKKIKLMHVEEVIERLKKVAPHLTLVKETYTRTHSKCTFIDEKYGEWITMPYPILNDGVDHPSRNKTITRPQQAICDFVTSLGFNPLQNVTPIIGSKKQIDVFIPNKKLGIEYNGIYYHTETFKKPSDHFDKRVLCEKNGITLIQINSDEWINKNEICKSIIKSKLGVLGVNVNGRDCEVKDLAVDESEQFLDANHLMGGYKSAKRLGLYHNDMLVSLMTYKTIEVNGIKTVDIVRFANKLDHNVRGSFSKLLKAIAALTKPQAVQSFVDLRYGTGASILKNGFILESTTLGFKWADKQEKTYNRLKCRANMDERKLTEKQHAEELGWKKIYDAGQAKFVKKLV